MAENGGPHGMGTAPDRDPADAYLEGGAAGRTMERAKQTAERDREQAVERLANADGSLQSARRRAIINGWSFRRNLALTAALGNGAIGAMIFLGGPWPAILGAGFAISFAWGLRQSFRTQRIGRYEVAPAREALGRARRNSTAATDKVNEVGRQARDVRSSAAAATHLRTTEEISQGPRATSPDVRDASGALRGMDSRIALPGSPTPPRAARSRATPLPPSASATNSATRGKSR